MILPMDAMDTAKFWMDEDQSVGLPEKGFYTTISFTDSVLMPYTAFHRSLQAPREVI